MALWHFRAIPSARAEDRRKLVGSGKAGFSPVMPADPGATLRPLLGYYVKHQGEPIHQEPPVLPNNLVAPEGSGAVARLTLDRHGLSREMEITDASPLPAPGQKIPSYLATEAKIVLTSAQKERDHPLMIDNAPCEWSYRIILVNGAH